MLFRYLSHLIPKELAKIATKTIFGMFPIWKESFSSLYFPDFGLNLKIYRVDFRIQFEYGKIWTRKILESHRGWTPSSEYMLIFKPKVAIFSRISGQWIMQNIRRICATHRYLISVYFHKIYPSEDSRKSEYYLSLFIVKLQSFCNLIGQKNVIFLIVLVASVQVSMECEMHEN